MAESICVPQGEIKGRLTAWVELREQTGRPAPYRTFEIVFFTVSCLVFMMLETAV